MNDLFLTSFFSNVSGLFVNYSKQVHVGKKITFIPTAANPEKVTFYVDADKRALASIGFVIDEIDISVADHQSIKAKINENEYVFVSGGNTFFLLQEMKRTGTDVLLAEELRKGKKYIGSSAGSIILSANIEYVKGMDSPKKAPLLSDYASLGIIDFYPLPHYSNAPFKKIAEKIVEEYSGTIDLRPMSNDQAIIVNGDQAITIRKKEKSE